MQAEYEVDRMIPRFPLVALYLKTTWAWPLLERQCLAAASKPSDPAELRL